MFMIYLILSSLTFQQGLFIPDFGLDINTDDSLNTVDLNYRKGLVITAVGDVNFSTSKTYIDSQGGVSGRGVFPFSHYSEGITDLIDGDLNYCNLETAVLSDNSLNNTDKSYCFRMHPNGFQHLCDIGFNLFSLANNHMEDYGREGVRRTLTNLNIIAQEYNVVFAGAGVDLESATDPVIIEVNGYRIAFSSIGFSGLPASSTRPGVATPNYFEIIAEKLRDAETDYRILAMHRGQERNPYVQAYQLDIARRAIEDYDVDLVLGNHPHIAQAVELVNGKLSFYSLGNFLMLGARNMASVEGGLNKKDFGLYTKIYLSPELEIDSVIILPIYDMHFQPHPVHDSNGVHNRIEWVNTISKYPYITGVENPIIFENNGERGIFIPGI